jgi:hypothetical protein
MELFFELTFMDIGLGLLALFYLFIVVSIACMVEGENMNCTSPHYTIKVSRDKERP